MAPLDVVVTVGMGPFPFDRLVRALDPVCTSHRVFAQIGTSTVRPRCEHRRFVAPGELHDRIVAADVVITHAGNTVRLVQRMGKVPVAVARRAEFGEMANDHQVAYLATECRDGRVVAVDDLAALADVVDRHPAVEQPLLAARAEPSTVDAQRVADRLDLLVGALLARSGPRRR